MSGPNTADQITAKYDVIIDGYGYVTARAVDPNMPFRVQQQNLSYSPTFVERQNVSNSYGDNAQDFFLTIRQRDWALGEQQKYFRVGQDGRYWMGSNVDVSTPGQVRLSPSVGALTFAAAVMAGARQTFKFNVVTASATTLYQVDVDGTITSLGVHGLGAAPSKFGVCGDGLSNYLSTTNAGTVGVRRWDGASFSTFSASAADSLAFLNNTLYGYRAANGDLVRWDTAGTLTSLFPWKGGNGTAFTAQAIIVPYGGKLLILFPYGQEAAELWIYDGIGTSRLAVFPENFVASDIEVLYGVAYIAGTFLKAVSSTLFVTEPAILFFDGSTIGKLWSANDFNSSSTTNVLVGAPAVGISNGRLIFTDDTTGNLMAYNPATGGVSSIGAFTSAGDSARIISTGEIQVHTRNQVGGYYFPASTYPSSGYVISSLIDFDSSLPKQFRGIKAEWQGATDGDGGSIDVAYQVDSLTGAWTTLQTNVTSGREYTLSSVTGHAIAVRVTINKGTSTSGPTLKTLSVRGAPILTSYRINEYILDLGGDANAQNPVMLRDEAPHPLNGEQMRANLAAAIQATSPVAVTDRTGTFTAMLEPANCEFDLTRPGQWYARIRVREI